MLAFELKDLSGAAPFSLLPISAGLFFRLSSVPGYPLAARMARDRDAETHGSFTSSLLPMLNVINREEPTGDDGSYGPHRIEVSEHATIESGRGGGEKRQEPPRRIGERRRGDLAWREVSVRSWTPDFCTVDSSMRDPNTHLSFASVWTSCYRRVNTT